MLAFADECFNGFFEKFCPVPFCPEYLLCAMPTLSAFRSVSKRPKDGTAADLNCRPYRIALGNQDYRSFGIPTTILQTFGVKGHSETPSSVVSIG